MNRAKVNKTLEKLAKGYSISEVTEEYALDGDSFKLVKKKETHKDIPPDMKAIMYLMQEEDFSSKSDEELEKEKRRLIEIICKGGEKTEG